MLEGVDKDIKDKFRNEYILMMVFFVIIFIDVYIGLLGFFLILMMFKLKVYLSFGCVI